MYRAIWSYYLKSILSRLEGQYALAIHEDLDSREAKKNFDLKPSCIDKVIILYMKGTYWWMM